MQVVLVNEKDQPIGIMEKMEAHQKGLLHRAFSVFIFDSKGRMLLQQRAAEKYHGANLWTNEVNLRLEQLLCAQRCELIRLAV